MSDDDKTKEDKDTILFCGYDGKVKFAEFGSCNEKEIWYHPWRPILEEWAACFAWGRRHESRWVHDTL